MFRAFTRSVLSAAVLAASLVGCSEAPTRDCNISMVPVAVGENDKSTVNIFGLTGCINDQNNLWAVLYRADGVVRAARVEPDDRRSFSATTEPLSLTPGAYFELIWADDAASATIASAASDTPIPTPGGSIVALYRTGSVAV